MRILMIIPQVFYSTRGTPISAYHRIRELIAHGHEVDVLTYRAGAEPPDLSARIYRSRGPHLVQSIKAGPSSWKIWFDVLLFFNLIYRLTRRRYDALYAHEEGAFLARIAGALFRTPYAYDMHSSLPRQILEWGFSSRKWVVDLFSWVERFSVTGARVVVAISPAVEQVARAVSSDVPVVVIVNHYEPPPGSDCLSGPDVRARHGIEPHANLVVYTGSFVALQALDMLIAAAPIVRSRVSDVRFLLVGGEQQEIEKLSALAAKFNVADCFVFEQTRPQREMAGYMAAANALVSPRIAGINPPGKLFSYLASGKPVVATNTLVHKQLLDSSIAVLTDPTPQQFAEGVIAALTDPVRSAQVVAGANAFLKSYCSAEARREAYRKLTSHLAGSAPGLVAPVPAAGSTFRARAGYRTGYDGARVLLVDAHVHIYGCFDLDALFDAAARNFSSAARSAGLADAQRESMLLLTETTHDHAFDALAAGELRPKRWSVAKTAEAAVLQVGVEGQLPLWLVAGRQIATREDLEVLALGTTDRFPDGQPISVSLAASRKAAAMTALPWGFGKWWGQRGGVIRQIMTAPRDRPLYSGDNGGRLAWSLRPRLLRLGERAGLRILPGTDPLPFAGQERRVGSFGMLIPDWNPAGRPLEHLVARLAQLPESPRQFGGLTGVTDFVELQIAMQLRKRKRAAQKSGAVKVLVVAPQPFLTARGTPLSVYYRTMVMAEHGARIDLLAYGEGEDVAIAGVRLLRIPRMPWIGPVAVGPSWKKLFLDVFMFAWTVGLLVRNRYDVVHAHEEAVFWCRFLKPLFRFRLIYDMHSSLPQQLTNFQFTRSRLMHGVFRILENTCLRKADAVITICPDLEDYALRTGVAPVKHVLIENSIFEDVRMIDSKVAATDTAHFPAVQGAALDPGRPTILYAGTFESYQGIDELIRAFGIVHTERPDALLLLVGGTAQQVATAAATVASLGLTDSVSLTGRVSKRLATRYTDLAHVLVSPRLTGTNTPLKIYEQLASGKPLVATRVWSHTQVLDDSVCILVDPDPQSLAGGLWRALSSPDYARQIAARARALYERQYARPVYERKIRRLLEIVS